jgi:hypothetical protein
MRNEDIPRFQTRKRRTRRSISVDQAAATGSEITHFRTPKICFGRQAERTTAGNQQPLAEGSSIPIKMGKIIILSWRWIQSAANPSLRLFCQILPVIARIQA